MDHFLGRNDEQIQCRGILHIVEAGDTLYKIGKKYGVPLSRVMYANPYVNVYNLQPGDEICVPVMTPRIPAGENRMPQQMDRDRITPVRENRMGGQVMPIRQNRREQIAPAQEDYAENTPMPVYENNMPDSRMPAYESNMPGSRMPARNNNMPGSVIPVCENPAMDSKMPGQKRHMQRHAVLAADDRRNGRHHANRMGFPLSSLEESIVDVSPETEGGVSMGNRMASAEENGRSNMREAVPKPEEDQSMRNQPDTDNMQEREDSDRRENEQNPSEPAAANHPDRAMAETEGCTEKEDCIGRRTSKTLPWDDQGVSEQMMYEYLQETPS